MQHMLVVVGDKYRSEMGHVYVSGKAAYWPHSDIQDRGLGDQTKTEQHICDPLVDVRSLGHTDTIISTAEANARRTLLAYYYHSRALVVVLLSP